MSAAETASALVVMVGCFAFGSDSKGLISLSLCTVQSTQTSALSDCLVQCFVLLTKIDFERLSVTTLCGYRQKAGSCSGSRKFQVASCSLQETGWQVSPRYITCRSQPSVCILLVRSL